MKSLLDLCKHTKFHKCCWDHCRDWRETKGWLPASDHAPSCSNYKEEIFYRVVAKGTMGPACIMETMAEVTDLCENDLEEYDIGEIKMTKDQFEHLDEFEGF